MPKQDNLSLPLFFLTNRKHKTSRESRKQDLSKIISERMDSRGINKTIQEKRREDLHSLFPVLHHNDNRLRCPSSNDILMGF